MGDVINVITPACKRKGFRGYEEEEGLNNGMGQTSLSFPERTDTFE